MPFRSRKQQKYMWAKHPGIARKWTNEAKRQGKSPVQRRSKKR